MAKRPLVQCRICKGKIDRDNQSDWCMPQDKWYYHISCYDDFAKRKGALKRGDLGIEADDDLWRSAVYEYLRRDIKMALDYRKFMSQWENLIKSGRTAKGIFFTLKYFYGEKKNSVDKSENGIGIVFYVYDEAAQYWGERNQRDKGICARIEAEILKSEAREVKVVQVQRKEKKKPTIDLAAIALTEDEDD